MKLTREFIFEHRSERGAWTAAQLALIGVKWPPREGWIDRVAGMDIPNSVADEFIRAANVMSERTIKKREKRARRKAQDEDRRRENACFSACDGIPTDFLEWEGANAVLVEAWDLFVNRK